jgi:hypothetical protein
VQYGEDTGRKGDFLSGMGQLLSAYLGIRYRFGVNKLSKPVSVPRGGNTSYLVNLRRA